MYARSLQSGSLIEVPQRINSQVQEVENFYKFICPIKNLLTVNQI